MMQVNKSITLFYRLIYFPILNMMKIQNVIYLEIWRIQKLLFINKQCMTLNILSSQLKIIPIIRVNGDIGNLTTLRSTYWTNWMKNLRSEQNQGLNHRSTTIWRALWLGWMFQQHQFKRNLIQVVAISNLNLKSMLDRLI